MPAQPKLETLSRLLELLKALPHHGWSTPAELRDSLAERGFKVDIRSIQRDLKALQKNFPLDHNDKGRPHGWRWSDEAAGGLAAMGTPEALAIVMVMQHLQAALPASQLAGFEQLHARARQKLDRLGARAGAARWPGKVRVLPPGLPAQIPSVKPDVQASVATALLHDRQLEATYAPGAAGKARPYVLHPIGLILRGTVTYLAANRGGASQARLYALHRMQEASALPSPAHPGRSLKQLMSRGFGQFGVPIAESPGVAIHLRCDPELARWLAECPLSDDQKTTVGANGWTDLHATLPDSWDLRWWLIGRGPAIEVMAPPELRTAVAEAHRDAAARYRQG